MKPIVAISIALIWNPISIGTAFTHHHAVAGMRTRKSTVALNIFKRKPVGNLPKPDPQDPERYIASSATEEFYPPSLSLFRSGPLPFITRLTNSDKYEQAVYKYMYQSSEQDLEEAQANMDAYFSSPSDWAEQKMMEQRGERPIFKYSEAAVDGERTVLTGVWASFIFYVAGKIVYTAITGGYAT
mmetsp:Transcript_37286/g.44498  ORF Transcript_37286/g.44498 Transcript_37286/m.44498 type:complete len:185 (-) Transcript_37286:63-617(-)|eukprot:CAMPEP_0198269442 /NCGR_PEP_ID=MMETSP1447-20131203/41287_1 /TAXON_ID=420782 /ORGANISM="Chaetoceros dichaeta, Strain CCMP1751" /LENGTH=184 /DNA_ID=CAMNT_0043961027 /DNA_START=148 /DNA_END=702 /DNA_ORIENTATION=-